MAVKSVKSGAKMSLILGLYEKSEKQLLTIPINC